MNKSLIFLMIEFLLKNENVRFLLEISSTLFSAVIGGLVAFYVARIQIRSNQKLEEEKNNKLYKNIIIVVNSDLEDFNKTLENIIQNKDLIESINEDKENKYFFQTTIPVTSLEELKNKFIYIIDEQDKLNLFLSVYNRLCLLKDPLSKLDIEKLKTLYKDIKDLNVFLKIISEKEIIN